jgi:hypothetical protein
VHVELSEERMSEVERKNFKRPFTGRHSDLDVFCLSPSSRSRRTRCRTNIDVQKKIVI